MPTVHMTRFDTVTQAYFPVSLQSVFVGDRTSTAQDYQAVVRDDTGAVLGIHRKDYKLVPNRAVFVPFEEVILGSGVALQGIKVQEGIAYGGRTVVREYIFPAVKVEPRVGDLVAFKLKVINSYDATNAFWAYAAGHRLCCLNGMVREERCAIVYARHTAGFSVEVAIDKIRQATERYLGTERRWAEWGGRAISSEAAAAVFAAMPETNPKRLARLQSAWETESAALGRTVWVLYTALTHWSSHAPVRARSEANRAAIVLAREALVARTLATDAFRQLAN